MSKHTPGPWTWQGQPGNLHLATTHSGRRYVMGFERKGMQGAEPLFQPENGMVRASELLKFAVGDPSITGETAAKADESVYRYDVIGIDCADARLIAAAPRLFDLVKLVHGSFGGGNIVTFSDEDINEFAAAIAQVEGENQ